ncbi:hypothetical protein SHKM778_65860 [Streptomyces sp. KM77-8]|uniref:Uncharacterized protein n=1 Tax=Streptomyces haneummycinicus TaxID=3074435 RepID=A0AAT9HSP5_9ACTN
MRVGEQFLQGEPVRVGAEAVAVRAEAQHHVEAPFGAVRAGEEGGEFPGVAAVDRGVRFADGLAEGLADDHGVDGTGVGAVHAGRGEDQPGQDLRLGHPAGLQGSAGRV